MPLLLNHASRLSYQEPGCSYSTNVCNNSQAFNKFFHQTPIAGEHNEQNHGKFLANTVFAQSKSVGKAIAIPTNSAKSQAAIAISQVCRFIVSLAFAFATIP
ncbi:hypothetical protein [Rivularia sp. UHCC 0363]|uniref:hypothetical protein n=1 Tax=Rivularia sp. UHCC 0363 TaxID=3110244 RepID=UPI002B210581|nr:hypothetical protein [Rivularia sp. UHCC 0363]MEA5597010.1 hypothetical protein [Rivularia sp. UHCC 0363]